MNELSVTTDNGIFVFVSRDGEEEFTLEEARAYLLDRKARLFFPGEPVVPKGDAHFGNCDVPAEEETVEATDDDWHIPDDKMRRHLFRKDLMAGIQFCVDKYGQSKEVIEAEARRLSLRGF